MHPKEKIPESGRDWFILAVNGDSDLLATATTFEEMNISLRIVAEMAELEKTLLDNGKPAGAIVSHKFLGAGAPAKLKRIKSIAPGLQLIIAASETSEAFEKAVRLIGIFYYLLAPYEREEFLSVIRALLKKESS